jgi:predicted N-formylglutamate amidohydrolase
MYDMSGGEPYFLCPGGEAPSLIFVCDHGGREIPEDYGDLGLPASAFTRHIAYDIGAADLTRALASRFGAPAAIGRYSRLFIDLNRGADDPTLVMKLSDGQVVPGNAAVDDAEIARRIALVHRPYHAAIAALSGKARVLDIRPVIVSIHTFTPSWRGMARPWEVAVLSSAQDRRLSDLLLTQFRSVSGQCVGDNQPYSGELENDTLSVHGLQCGLDHTLIEVRQDLVSCAAGVTRMANVIAPCLERAIARLGAATASTA